MKIIRKLLCRLGLHKKKVIFYEVPGSVGGVPQILKLRYDACIHCGCGDPAVTGEW